MRVVTCISILAVVAPLTSCYPRGADLLNELNDEVNKINELVGRISGDRELEFLSEYYDYAPILKKVAIVLQDTFNVLEDILQNLEKPKESHPEQTAANPTRKNLDVKSRVSSGLSRASYETLADALAIMDTAHKVQEASRVRERAEDNADDSATMAPPTEVRPPISKPEIFRDLIDEALSRAFRREISENPQLQQTLGNDFNLFSYLKRRY